MSRGGTKKARAAQEADRRKRAKANEKQAVERAKAAKAEAPKVGKGRAFLLHLSGLPATFVISFSLVLSANVGADGTPLEETYWLSPLIEDANASYFEEPGGLLFFAGILSITIALFFLAPVMVWRYVYRDWDVVRRDRSSVDNAFTVIVIALVMWLFRIVAGYSTTFHGFVQLIVLLAVYIPFFSGVLAVILPVIPGSGRVGGILPDFMKIPFTERFLLNDEERAEARTAAQAAKDLRRRQYDEARAARAARKKKK